MSRVAFKTGKAHQEAAAVWARRRLGDRGGRCFTRPDDQDGVLFADSVGMGKTWEALAAAALLLYKTRPERGRRHIVIACPANLITKWEEELAEGSLFREALNRWRKGIKTESGRRYANRVVDTLSHVLPIRRGQHVSIRLKHAGFHPLGGTYIISHGLVTRRGRGLAALRREPWDVIIIDEAHNAAARKAIEKLEPFRRARTKLLLSATPFQLDPRQWNGLAKHVIKTGHKVLSRHEVSRYLEKVAALFQDPNTQSGPSKSDVNAASTTLRKIAVRTIPHHSRRRYSVLLLDGGERSLSASLDELDESSVKAITENLRRTTSDQDFDGFSRAYFERRLELATGEQPTFVATALRRFLSMGDHSDPSPRLTALERWARGAFAGDIEAALSSGLPHKTIVFTSWVGDATNGEAARLRNCLESAFQQALDVARHKHRSNWDAWRKAGLRRLEVLPGGDERDLRAVVRALGQDELTIVLSGAHQGFLTRLRKATRKQLEAVRGTERDFKEAQDRFEARALRRRLNDMRAALNPWIGRPLRPVERYTGGDERTARDRVATAFRQIGPPWVLVASHVGSEGIDLQTYTHRIVHYDLEWNPARMEQREGRGDRVGRILKDDLRILYCLVPRTYDERMFHQLVARDRWHGVLLGKPAQALDTEQANAPLVDRSRLARMRLRLAPTA